MNRPVQIPNPAPLPRHRRRKWQSKGQRHRAFLRALNATGCAAFAAAIVDVDRTTPYLWRDEDPAFALAWEAGRYARRTHHPDRLTRPIERMNDKMLMLAIKRGARRRSRISTLDQTIGQAKDQADQGTDRL